MRLFSLLEELSVKPRGVIQVGASAGQEIQTFYELGLRKGIFIEPLHAPYDEMAEACKVSTEFQPLKVLIGSEDAKEVTFHVASNYGMSSSILEPASHLDIHPSVGFADKRTMKTYRLDTVMMTLNNDDPDYDLLFLDCQGAELHVLLGATKTLNRIQYIWTEVNFGGLYKEDVSYRQMVDFMDMRGFFPFFTGFNRHGIGDALFVRKNLFPNCK